MKNRSDHFSCWYCDHRLCQRCQEDSSVPWCQNLGNDSEDDVAYERECMLGEKEVFQSDSEETRSE